MPLKTAFYPAASWTHKLDSEKQQEHDFSNLLQEFGYALRRQDGKMIEYFECELRRDQDRRRRRGEASVLLEIFQVRRYRSTIDTRWFTLNQSWKGDVLAEAAEWQHRMQWH
jgi:hypothetical protein